jgi:pyruvate dehydrogenase E1 component alpha subunit
VVLEDEDLELLLLIRLFEQKLLDLFAEGELSGTTHTCIGQEYVPVAIAPLTREDFIFSNHRGHGHYLAHCGDPEGLLAEIMGREGAPCSGVGGSQHLLSERLLTTGVQGESLPIAVGMALYFKRSAQHRAAVAYIGDGTWGEGAVYEALNMAQLWRVPMLVVVENNGIAQTTPTSQQLAGTVADRAKAFGIDYHHIATTDIELIRTELAPRIDHMRTAEIPLIVEFETVRLGPHSKGDDSRPAAQVEALWRRDWLALYAASMPERIKAATERQQERLAEIVSAVRMRPLSRWAAA